MSDVRRIVLMGGLEEMHLIIMDERHLDNGSGRQRFEFVLAEEQGVCCCGDLKCQFAVEDVTTKIKCCVLCGIGDQEVRRGLDELLSWSFVDGSFTKSTGSLT
jgi:hypothetical protein